MFRKINKIGNHYYAYLAESYRPNSRSFPRHRILAYLGRVDGVSRSYSSFKPKFIEPMRPSFLEEIPKDFDKGYIAELKLDGSRTLGYFTKKGQAFINRRKVNKTEIYPELKDIHKKLNFKKNVVLDGEIVAIKKGKSDFKTLSERDRLKDKELIMIRSKTHPLEYHVFDILELDGKDIKKLPLSERKKILDKVVPDNLKEIKEIKSQPLNKLLKQAKEREDEGVIIKKLDSPYQEGKLSKDWIKLKLLKENDTTAIGFQKGVGKRKGLFGSILMGVWDKDGWRYVGRVGTGFNDKELKRITERMNRLKVTKIPDIKNHIPESEKKRTVWIKPEIVMRVKFLKLTEDKKYREPSYIGERTDIKSHDTHVTPSIFKLPKKASFSFRSKLIEVEKKGRIVKTRKPEEVLQIATEIKRIFSPLSQRFDIAGSIRRKRKDPVDIDLVLIPKDKQAIQNKLERMGATIISKGDKKVESTYKGVKTDFFFTTPKSYGAALMTRTGPMSGNLGNRSLAKNKKLILNEYGLFKRTKEGKAGRYIAGRTEKEIYEALGKTYRPPELRGLPRGN